jgi:hypothetical protein
MLRGQLTCLQHVASAVGHAVLLYAVVSPPHVLHPSGGAAIATLSAPSEITHPLAAMLDFELIWNRKILGQVGNSNASVARRLIGQPCTRLVRLRQSASTRRGHAATLGG